MYCQECPQDIRDWILKLQKRESSHNNSYGSRKVFFDRVWTRMHGEKEQKKPAAAAEDDDEQHVLEEENVKDETIEPSPKRAKTATV